MKSLPIPPHYLPQLTQFGLSGTLPSPPFLACFDKGEYLCREGEPLDYIMYVVKGRIKISITTSTGRTLLIRFTENWGIIGSLEMLSNQVVTASNLAVTPVEAIAVPLHANLAYLRQSQPFLLHLATTMSVAFVDASKYSAINILLPLKPRLCSYIVLTQENGLFTEKLTDTAELLGISYRHLLRALQELCKENLLKKQTEGYRILNLARLSQLAGDYYLL